MKNHSFTYTTIAMLVALAITIAISPTYIGNMKPANAQLTPDTTSSPTISPDTDSPTGTGASDDGENFQQFMDCLFGGEASEEDITSAIDGTGESTPTEQEIRDCFDPLYNTAGATDTPTAAGSGSTGETDDEGESSADDGTSDDEGESEN